MTACQRACYAGRMSETTHHIHVHRKKVVRQMSGTLFIVATPIGNLDDLTPRARQTLAQVSLIAAEDTRHTGRLLMHIGCKTRLMALHDHNEEKVVADLIAALRR